jgi:hypothetical protein
VAEVEEVQAVGAAAEAPEERPEQRPEGAEDNAPPASAKRKRRPVRSRDGAKTGNLTPTRLLAGSVKAKNEALKRQIEQDVAAWRDDLERDLGGDLSAQERTLVGFAASKMRLALALAAWIEQRPGRVVRGDGAVADVADHFLRASQSAERTLAALGLKRRARPVDTLRDALEEIEQARATKDASEPGDEEEIAPPESLDEQPLEGSDAQPDEGDLVAVPVEVEPEARTLPAPKVEDPLFEV